jgi:thymidylate synthase
MPNPTRFVKATNFAELYSKALTIISRDGEESSPRGLHQKEVMHFNYEVTNPADCKLTPQFEGQAMPNYEYGEAFAAFVLSGADEMPQSLKDLNPVAAMFDYKSANDFSAYSLPPNFSFFYGPRIHSQLQNVIDELSADNDSRRATISVLYGEQDNSMLEHLRKGEVKNLEYPCTVAFQFLIRNGKLNVQTVMRSQNMVGIFPYDFLITSKLLHAVAEKLGVEVGSIFGSIWSAHYYVKDQSRVDQWVI